jgi:hypothetical protein
VQILQRAAADVAAGAKPEHVGERDHKRGAAFGGVPGAASPCRRMRVIFPAGGCG